MLQSVAGGAVPGVRECGAGRAGQPADAHLPLPAPGHHGQPGQHPQASLPGGQARGQFKIT